MNECHVISCIPKEDRAATYNHKVVVMVKSIPHEGRHQIQTKVGILDRLYPTGEFNVIPSVDQDRYRKEFSWSTYQAYYVTCSCSEDWY